jgi:hypothetical protein
MSSLTVPTFGTQNHPAGQITLSPRRNLTARASALVGFRVDMLLQATTMTLAQAADPALCDTAS